jgi:hypothetical protein
LASCLYYAGNLHTRQVGLARSARLVHRLEIWRYASKFKKESEAQVKAGYRILRTLDNDESSWNMLTLREFKSFARMEADEDAGLRRFSAPAP